MASVLETRLLQAQTEQLAPIDLLAALVSDELQPREDRLLARRHKQARFRDPDRSLDGFDFAFNKKINRALVFELATALHRPARGSPPDRPTRYREESSCPGHRPRRYPAGLPRPLTAKRTPSFEELAEATLATPPLAIRWWSAVGLPSRKSIAGSRPVLFGWCSAASPRPGRPPCVANPGATFNALNW